MQKDFWGCTTSPIGNVQQKIENIRAKLREQVKIVTSESCCVCVCVTSGKISNALMLRGCILVW